MTVRPVILCIAAVMLLFDVAEGAAAEDIPVAIQNARRDLQMVELWVSRTGGELLGEALQGTTIDFGWNFELIVSDADGCVFDFRGVFSDGSERAENGFDGCNPAYDEFMPQKGEENYAVEVRFED